MYADYNRHGLGLDDFAGNMAFYNTELNALEMLTLKDVIFSLIEMGFLTEVKDYSTHRLAITTPGKDYLKTF